MPAAFAAAASSSTIAPASVASRRLMIDANPIFLIPATASGFVAPPHATVVSSRAKLVTPGTFSLVTCWASTDSAPMTTTPATATSTDGRNFMSASIDVLIILYDAAVRRCSFPLTRRRRALTFGDNFGRLRTRPWIAPSAGGRMRSIVVAAAILLLVGSRAEGQGGATSAISGVVTDAAAAVVPGATVVV